MSLPLLRQTADRAVEAFLRLHRHRRVPLHKLLLEMLDAKAWTLKVTAAVIGVMDRTDGLWLHWRTELLALVFQQLVKPDAPATFALKPVEIYRLSSMFWVYRTRRMSLETVVSTRRSWGPWRWTQTLPKGHDHRAKIDLWTRSLVFQFSSLWPETVQCNAHVTADSEPIHGSISGSILPPLVNQNTWTSLLLSPDPEETSRHGSTEGHHIVCIEAESSDSCWLKSFTSVGGQLMWAA